MFVSLLLISSADAAGGDVVTPSIFANVNYNSNTFRLSDDTNSGANGQNSTQTRTYGGGLRIVKSYGLQDFLLDATLTRYSYSNFSGLDATGHDLNGVYTLRATPSIVGTLTYRNTTAPSDFADVGFQTQSNLRTDKQKRIDTDWLSGAALHPRISFDESQTSTGRPTFQQENSRIRSLIFSGVYLFVSNNSFAPYFRKANGDYQDLIPDPTAQLATNFRERQAGVRLHWIFNGLSGLDADVGYLDRTHQGLAVRNFSGFVGNLDYGYQVTGKTRLQFQAGRQLYSSQSFISSYVDEERASVSAIWAATGNISVVPSFIALHRTFKGATLSTAPELRESSRTFALAVNWTPLRNLTLTAGIGYDARTATFSSLDYTNRSAQLGARFHF